MSMCGRCAARSLIRKYNGDVIELIILNKYDWTVYEFYVPVIKPEEGYKFIEQDSKLYRWALTICSEKHSNDEDCYDETGKKGFAKTRIVLENEIQND